MIRNYIKTAGRSLIKQKIYTGINVLGLAVSISACLLIVLYVKHELSYDTFFPNADRIYKLVLERKYPNHSTFFSVVPHSYADAITKDFPEVEKVLQMGGPAPNTLVRYKASATDIKVFEEDYYLFTDSSFFDFFDINLIKGDKKTALASPNQIIMSATAAERYFGKEDPLGKVLEGDGNDRTVTGVFEDLPDNSHLRFDFLAAFSGAQFRRRENYTGFDSHTYLKMKPGASAAQLEAKFPKMVDTYASAQIERDLKQSWADYSKAGNGYRYFLQPLTSIHLDPTNLEFTMSEGGNKKYVYALLSIAGLILVIACINFMNLATARSSERAREVGVRKVMGSQRQQLISQFLLEAIMLTLIGTALAIGVALLALPAFNQLVEKQLQLTFSADVVGGLVGFAVFVGLLAGLYPAFVLSSYNPVVVMKGNFSSGSKGSWLRNGLVVFQFMISIILIVGTLVVGQQLRFVQSKDLGFDKEQVMMVERAFDLGNQTKTFIDEVKTLPEVISAAGTNTRPGNRNEVFGQMFQPEGSSEVLTVKTLVMDDNFGQLIGFRIKDGRGFAEETADSLNILLNETAVKTIGLTDPIGKRLLNTRLFEGNEQLDRDRFFTIVGVVEDFHFQSLKDEITPLVLLNKEIFGPQSNNGFVAIKIKAGGVQAVVEKIEQKWRTLVPESPFRYDFLDENLKRNYIDDQRSGKLFAVFSGLAIVIACVGLFGLSAYTASLRTKEIGIRKVLGATVPSVILLLSKEFSKLVIISFVIATPLAWWMMSQWLGTFVYRIPLTAGSFILAGALAFGISWFTVSYQSIKAAIVNPVNSLRSE